MIIFITLINRLKQLRQRLLHSEFSVVVISIVWLVLIGTVAYSLIEGWPWLDALYATIITITTVGYGDFSPQTTYGRIFTIFFTLFAIGIASYAISSLAAIIIEQHGAKCKRKLRRRRMKQIETLEKHMILCGADTIGKRIAKEFYETNTPFIIVEPNDAYLKQTMLYMHHEYFEKKVATLHDFVDSDISEYEEKSLTQLADEVGVLYLLDDPTDDSILVQAGIARAKGLVSALADDRDNLSVIVGARALARRLENEELRIMSRVSEEKYIRKLFLAGADNVRLPAIIGGFQIASYMLNPEMGAFWDYMLYGTQQRIRFSDIAIAERPDWVGKSVAYLKHEYKHIVIAIKRNDEYLSAPDSHIRFKRDDILIILGPAKL